MITSGLYDYYKKERKKERIKLCVYMIHNSNYVYILTEPRESREYDGRNYILEKSIRVHILTFSFVKDRKKETYILLILSCYINRAIMVW